MTWELPEEPLALKSTLETPHEPLGGIGLSGLGGNRPAERSLSSPGRIRPEIPSEWSCRWYT
jgi:hypothetical protein